jgi:peptide/nickel transport system substrate-binding protein
MTIPDEQTRTANFLTDNVDLVTELTVDQIADLRTNPKYKFTASPGMQIYYLQLDAIGKSGRKELGDPRVRKAIFMAVDREALIKAMMPAPDIAKAPAVFCHEVDIVQIGCVHSKTYAPYDPAGARKLLAEAGYPNGFELIVDSSPPEVKMIGEALTGMLTRIGIKARHMPLPSAVYRDWQRDGKLEAHIAPWTMAPDVSRSLNRFFTLGGQTDMFGDKMLADLRIAGERETDPEKRRALYSKLYDRVIDESLMLPITTVPNVFVHSADLKINPGSINGWGLDLYDFSWN